MAKKIKWTKQQGRAIGEWGRDVFVTASAGTGKTAVLSGRCVSIAAKRGVCPDVWSQLVLTFTDMAAEEMRSRIAEQLRVAMAASEDGEERGHLRRQLLLLGGADISTIHSFCKRLITEYFYEVGLDPSFGVLDADESRLLKMESLEKTVDRAWEQENLAQGLGELLGRRDLRVNEGFLSQIVEISDYLDGVVNRDSWYERARALAEEANPFDGDTGKEQKRMVARRIEAAVDRIRRAQRLYRQSGTGRWAQSWDREFVQPLSECLEVLKKGDWERFVGLLSEVKPPKSNKPDAMDGAAVEVIRVNAETAKKELKGLWQLAILNPEYLDRIGGAVGLQTMVMLELVKRFEQFYGEAKGAINCLDFADLQRYAVKLLCAGFDEEGRAVPSETAKALRGRYKYIFVDEYQDINAVQQTILDMLSEGGNVFGVGDAKQSIYAWRGARPAIFLERVDGAVVEPVSSNEGLRVDLNVNFRSDSRILEFVNAVFSKVMTKELCHIEYDESAQLRAGEQNSESAGDGDKIVEVHILDERGRQEEQEEAEGNEDDDLAEGTYSGRQRQAALIAQRIRRMVGADTPARDMPGQAGRAEFQIFDKGEQRYRDVEYRDIVILMRSVARKVDFVEVLRLAGLPVSCEATAGYFEATEISDMLCLLCVLDNPRRDIELAAVLRSPLFGITDTELAKIRLHKRKVTSQQTEVRSGEERRGFYECVVDYSEAREDSGLAEKLRGVLERIEGWRTEARRGKLADLIWRVYRETGYLSFVCALPSGMGRRANLLKLHERAIQFEGFASSGGVASLSRFINFVEKLVELGQDWSAAGPETAAGNTVRVLSVHKSKGLEFPVVFLADLNNRFNMADARGECLVDDEYGLGLKVIDDEAGARFSSPGFEVIAEKRRDTSLAEEMRILYVAMTRARERLVLVGAQKAKRCREILCNGLLSVGRIAEWQLRSCKSHFEWVLYGLSDSSELAEMFETGLGGKGDGDKLFCAKLYGEGEERRLNSYIEKIRKSKAKRAGKRKVKAGKGMRGAKLPAGLKERLGWRYGYGDAAVLPAKRSVTQWTHRDDEFVQRDYSRVLERRPRALSEGVVEDSAQGRLVGTATHLVLSKLELTERISEDAVRAVLEEKVGEGAITASVGRCVDVGAIVGFFESDVGRVALDKSNTVFREWSFTFAVPASEWLSETGTVAVGDDETIIVQGIIDMLIEIAEGVLIVDFKTDAVDADEVAERAQVYKRQLELYGRAAGAILKQNVAGKWLYFLGPGCAVEIE